MTQWFCIIGGTQRGPYSDAQVRQLASSGQLAPTDFIWKEGLADWVPASKIKGLFAGATPSAASAASAPAPRSAPMAAAVTATVPAPRASQPAPVTHSQPVSAGVALPFKVFVKSPQKDIGRGSFQCQITPTGLSLTRKKRSTVAIPIGTAINYDDGSLFTATLPNTTVTVRINMLTKYQIRFTRDLVTYLRGQGAAPDPTGYTMEWYYLVAIFIPMVAFGLWWGAIAWGVTLCIVSAVAFVAGQEKWNRWLRLATAYAIGVLFVGILLSIHLVMYIDSRDRARAQARAESPAPSKPAFVAPAPEPRFPTKPPAQPSPVDAAMGPVTQVQPDPVAPKPRIEDPVDGKVDAGKPTPLELEAKLAKIPGFWRPAKGTPEELLPTMVVRRRVMVGDTLVLAPRERMVTQKSYLTPISFRLIVMPDGKDFRLGFAADQVILNWGGRPDELRVDGGPANGAHKPGAGRLPSNQWVAIEWVVLPDEMVLYVDGVERYRHSADFSRIDKPFSLTAHSSRLQVKSITVVRP